MLLLSNVFAQKETNYWAFSDSVLMNFNSFPPSASNAYPTYALETCASVSDTNGNLLFFTNGEFVKNKFGQYMFNGVLWNNQLISTSTQGAIIIPKPNSSTQYYLILNNNWCGGRNVLYYTIIDVTLNFGSGVVLFSPIPFYSSSTNVSEKLAIAKHCNGKDFWLLTTEVNFYGDSVELDPVKYSGQRMKNVNFLSFFIDENGINNYPVKSNTNVQTNACEQYSDCAAGQMKLAPNGKLAAFGHFEDLYIYDFNNSNGQFNFNKRITYQPNYSVPDFCDYVNYGLEFFNDSKNMMFNNLFVDLENDTTALLGDFIYSQLQLASDNKIYFAYNTKANNQFGLTPKDKLSFFQLIGNQPTVFYDTISIGNALTNVGFPNFPSYYFDPKKYDFSYSGSCAETTFDFTADFNGYSYTSLEWTFLDDNSTSTSANTQHVFPTSGSYEVQLVVFNNGVSDTVKHCIEVLGSHPDFFPNYSLDYCYGSSFEIGTTYPNVGHFLWSTGDTTSLITINKPGDYILTITNQCASYSDTLKVSEEICGESELIIPNIFSPNGDETNDIFSIKVSHYKNVRFYLFDRWGTPIFTNEIEISESISKLPALTEIKLWNGTLKNGHFADDGTYFFILKTMDLKGNISDHKGFLQLVR